MLKQKLILIGPINNGNVACTGDTVKNQLFIKRFSEIFESVLSVDTYNWRKRPWCLIQMMVTVLYHRNVKVIISANPGSANILIRILNWLNVSYRTFYWVVGGSLHKDFEEKSRDWHNYTKLAGVFVQGKIMEKSMQNIGLNNVSFVPNSKYIDFIPVKKIKSENKTHFVFLSRIEQYKGCDDIFGAMDILQNKGYQEQFDVTFYGKTTDELGYFNSFIENINNRNNAVYKGVINLKDTKKYEELAKYDVMLFPTYWAGEGFPGVMIDAYISGLPVIASDWNLNTDIVMDNVTGWIIHTHDVNALAERMIFAIKHPTIIRNMSIVCQNHAKEYDIRNVLSENNLNKLGLIP